MKYDKSLEEVWQWKEKVYEELKELSWPEKIKKIQRDVAEISKKYNLTLRKVTASRI